MKFYTLGLAKATLRSVRVARIFLNLDTASRYGNFLSSVVVGCACSGTNVVSTHTLFSNQIPIQTEMSSDVTVDLNMPESYDTKRANAIRLRLK